MYNIMYNVFISIQSGLLKLIKFSDTGPYYICFVQYGPDQCVIYIIM